MNKKPKHQKVVYQGLPLVDAKSGLHIAITKADVAKSKKLDPAKCAAAIALQRQLQTEVLVYLTKTYIKRDKKWVRYTTPESLAREIVSFDRSSNFDAGRYHLRPVSPSNRLGTHRGAKGKEGNGKPPRPYHATGHIREQAPRGHQ